MSRQSKNLHFHSLPIAVLGIAGLVASVPFIVAKGNNISTSLAINESAKQLTAQTISIHGQDNGLASIHFNSTNQTDNSTQTTNNIGLTQANIELSTGLATSEAGWLSAN